MARTSRTRALRATGSTRRLAPATTSASTSEQACYELEQPNILTLDPLTDSPVMSYDSVTSDANRLAKCKNLTMFNKELAANTLPQWMFITPNMSKLDPSPPSSSPTSLD